MALSSAIGLLRRQMMTVSPPSAVARAAERRLFISLMFIRSMSFLLYQYFSTFFKADRSYFPLC
jgi:hypothetical protein